MLIVMAFEYQKENGCKMLMLIYIKYIKRKWLDNADINL